VTAPTPTNAHRRAAPLGGWARLDGPAAVREGGFTLLEVLVAMATMAFIAVTVVIVMRNAVEVAEETRARTELSQMGRNATEIIRRELAMAFVSTELTEEWKTVFKATNRDPIDEVTFVTRAHEKRYANVKEGDQAEISYLSESGPDGGFQTLLHRESPIVDAEPEKGGTVLALCHAVRRLDLRYFDPLKEEWLDEWDSEGADHAGRVPTAVEIRLELEDKDGREASFATRTLILPAAR
jgi:type II secretory pathway pseudopilin PulG